MFSGLVAWSCRRPSSSTCETLPVSMALSRPPSRSRSSCQFSAFTQTSVLPAHIGRRGVNYWAVHCLLTGEHLHQDPLPVGIDGLERFGALLSILTPLSRPAAIQAAAERWRTGM